MGRTLGVKYSLTCIRLPCKLRFHNITLLKDTAMTAPSNATPNNQAYYDTASYKLITLSPTDNQGLRARLYTLSEYDCPKYARTIPMDYAYNTMLNAAMRELRIINNANCTDKGYTNTNEILLKLSPTQYTITFINRANWA